MLYLIGLGLWNEKSMSVEALEAAKECAVLYAEFYTSSLFGTTPKKLEKALGKIEVLPREDVEATTKILDAAEKKKIALLVAGDALTATTHTDLLIEAKKRGVETRVIHGASIYTAAAGLAGLQIYKFGRSTTIAYPEEGFAPRSHYDVIKYNKGLGLHSLVLLDVKPDKWMTANEAMQVLLDIEKEAQESVFTEDTEVVVLARVGSEKPLVQFGKVKDLLKKEFGKPMHTLIIPGKLHFKEEEYLKGLE